MPGGLVLARVHCCFHEAQMLKFLTKSSTKVHLRFVANRLLPARVFVQCYFLIEFYYIIGI